MKLNRLDTILQADPTRVILRDRGLACPVEDILERMSKLDDSKVQFELDQTIRLFEDRHRNFRQRIADTGRRNCEKLGVQLDGARLELLGAYLTMEYSVQAAALFNPSIVPLQNEDTGSGYGFVMSLRSVGEGHISSIEFVQWSVQ